MIRLLAHPLPLPTSRQQIVSLFQYSCVSPVEPTDGRGGGGMVDIRPRERLILYKSFNILCVLPMKTLIPHPPTTNTNSVVSLLLSETDFLNFTHFLPVASLSLNFFTAFHLCRPLASCFFYPSVLCYSAYSVKSLSG